MPNWAECILLPIFEVIKVCGRPQSAQWMNGISLDWTADFRLRINYYLYILLLLFTITWCSLASLWKINYYSGNMKNVAIPLLSFSSVFDLRSHFLRSSPRLISNECAHTSLFIVGGGGGGGETTGCHDDHFGNNGILIVFMKFAYRTNEVRLTVRPLRNRTLWVVILDTGEHRRHNYTNFC